MLADFESLLRILEGVRLEQVLVIGLLEAARTGATEVSATMYRGMQRWSLRIVGRVAEGGGMTREGRRVVFGNMSSVTEAQNSKDELSVVR